MFALATGAYELSIIGAQIVEWIKLQYPKLEKVEENFKLSGNEATSKAELVFKGDYGVDSEVQSSVHDILGFDKDQKIEGTRGDQANICGRYAENLFWLLFGTHPQIFFHK